MPNSLILKFSEETGRSVGEVERLWRKAKKIALGRYRPSHKNYYRYVVGILKRMLDVTNPSSLKESDVNLDLINYDRAFNDNLYFMDSIYRVAERGSRVPFYLIKIFDWDKRLDAETYFRKEGVTFSKVPNSVDTYYVGVKDSSFIEKLAEWMKSNQISFKVLGVIFSPHGIEGIYDYRHITSYA